MTNKTMIFGDDSSTSADLAWLWINSHRWPHWRLEIVKAVMPDLGAPVPDAAVPHEWHPVDGRSVFSETHFDEVVQMTCIQDPRLALSRAADLVVIGPRGAGLTKAMHLGSTAEWLMKRPSSPLLIVRHGRLTRTAVICHDGSHHATAATDLICQLPWVDELSVTLLVVNDGRADVDATIATATASLAAAGAKVQHQIRHGEPTHEITSYLEKASPDLLVLGTQGLTGWKKFRQGSTASALAHSSPSSVLMVRHEIEAELIVSTDEVAVSHA